MPSETNNTSLTNKEEILKYSEMISEIRCNYNSRFKTTALIIRHMFHFFFTVFFYT